MDKNRLAVELAKLSLWLVTLSKNRPFAFLDHALRSGDSLVGLSDIRQLEEFALKKEDGIGGSLFGQMTEIISNVVNAARTQRNQLEHNPSNTFADIEAKASIYEHVQRQTVRLKYFADVIVASYWKGGRANQLRSRLQGAFHEHFDRFRDGSPEEQSAAARAVRMEVGCPTPLHWPIEFPEVFQRRHSGFDAIVGNPPFMGGSKIVAAMSRKYREHLVMSIADGLRGAADLCGYFVRRASTLIAVDCVLGFLATKTIAQGDTREVCFDPVVDSGFTIFRAISSQAWPGAATLEIALIWLRRGSWNGDFVLNDVVVAGISSLLVSDDITSSLPYTGRSRQSVPSTRTYCKMRQKRTVRGTFL